MVWGWQFMWPFDNTWEGGPKIQNQATGALFRVCRCKWQQGTMEGWGGVWGMRWWWWSQCPIKYTGGGGFWGQINPKTMPQRLGLGPSEGWCGQLASCGVTGSPLVI